MKRILLFVCCMYAASTTVTYAQQATPQANATGTQRPTVSKTEYNAKVAKLNSLANQGKKDEARATFDELHPMLHAALGATKYRIKDAMDAQNDAQKAHYMDVMKKQNTLYNDIVMMRQDLITNKDNMNRKLNEFGTTIE
jgi:hypothetical protein